jgi:hypothetical protein
LLEVESGAASTTDAFDELLALLVELEVLEVLELPLESPEHPPAPAMHTATPIGAKRKRLFIFPATVPDGARLG